MVDLTLKTFITFLSLLLTIPAITAQSASLSDVDVRGDANGIFLYNANGNGSVNISFQGTDTFVQFDDKVARLYIDTNRKGQLLFLQGANSTIKMVHVSKKSNGQVRTRNIPLWLSLIPSLIAIILALIFKEVVVSSFDGIWSGAFIIGDLLIESFYYFIISFFEVIQTFIIGVFVGSTIGRYRDNVPDCF